MEGINCLELLVDGQRDGLACLYKLFSRDLYKYGMSICGVRDEVEECIHDFFVFLWESREKLKDISNPKAYLIISFKRKLIKQLKNIKHTDDIDIKYERNYFEQSVEDKWIDNESTDDYTARLGTAMKTLSSRERQVVHLKYFEKYKNEEIAQLLEITNQSVRNLLYRAIQNLKQKL